MLFGFAPWIVYWVLVGNVPFAAAAYAAVQPGRFSIRLPAW